MPVEEPAELTPGSLLGDYRIDGKIQEGAMGVVFAATHTFLGRRAAVKVIRNDLPGQAKLIERFIREACAAGKICHPNIVDVFSFGTLSDGRPYFVMELLRGQSLTDHLRCGALSIAESVSILEQVCRALKVTHAHGVIHRDLKPDNIFLVGEKDEPVLVKLLDFGVAKLVSGDAGGPRCTREGAVIGTPLYMSPEQARGQEVDYRSDVYSLGVVTFEMLCGDLPFAASGAVRTVVSHLSDTVPRPSSLRAEIAAPLDRLLLQMLSREPAERPSLEHILTITAALRPALSGIDLNQICPTDPMMPMLGRAEPLPRPAASPAAPRPSKRFRVLAVGASFAVGLTVGALAWLGGTHAGDSPLAAVEAENPSQEPAAVPDPSSATPEEPRKTTDAPDDTTTAPADDKLPAPENTRVVSPPSKEVAAVRPRAVKRNAAPEGVGIFAGVEHVGGRVEHAVAGPERPRVRQVTRVLRGHADQRTDDEDVIDPFRGEP